MEGPPEPDWHSGLSALVWKVAVGSSIRLIINLNMSTIPAIAETTPAKVPTQEFFHYPLFRNVLLAEWAFLAVCGFAVVMFHKFSPDDQSINLPLTLALLFVLVNLSLFRPVESPYSVRVMYVLSDVLVLTLTNAVGVPRFQIPLSLVVIAKAALLLDRRGVIAAIAITYISLWVTTCYKVWICQPEFHAAALTPNTIFVIAIGGFVLTFTYLLVLLLVGLLMIAFAAEQKSRLETERLSREVQSLAAEVERARIAREIHDGLGHSLTSLRIQLEVVKKFSEVNPTKAKEAMALAEELAARSLTDVRHVLTTMRNPDFDFEESLTRLVDELRASQSVEIDFHADGVEMPLETGFQVYRIVQEAITNVLKHAKATNVSVQIQKREKGLEVEVKDNGCGFDPQGMHGGFGLTGIRERTQQINGNLVIDSTPGSGTRILVEIPKLA